MGLGFLKFWNVLFWFSHTLVMSCKTCGPDFMGGEGHDPTDQCMHGVWYSSVKILCVFCTRCGVLLFKSNSIWCICYMYLVFLIELRSNTEYDQFNECSGSKINHWKLGRITYNLIFFCSLLEYSTTLFCVCAFTDIMQSIVWSFF